MKNADGIETSCK